MLALEPTMYVRPAGGVSALAPCYVVFLGVLGALAAIF